VSAAVGFSILVVLVLPGFTGRGATVVKAEDVAPDGANIVFWMGGYKYIAPAGAEKDIHSG